MLLLYSSIICYFQDKFSIRTMKSMNITSLLHVSMMHSRLKRVFTNSGEAIYKSSAAFWNSSQFVIYICRGEGIKTKQLNISTAIHFSDCSQSLNKRIRIAQYFSSFLIKGPCYHFVFEYVIENQLDIMRIKGTS